LIRAKLRPLEKGAYAFGGTIDIFGHWLYFGLMQPVFVGFLQLSPSLFGLAQAAARLTDAFTDSYFGWRSDNTRTRWGRRRPFVLVGGLLSGALLPCMFAASRSWSASTLFWFVLLTACGYAPILSCYNMPYQSLGAELTPDTDERTSVMSWRGVVQTLAGVANAWAWWFAARPWFADAGGAPNLARGAMWAGVIAGALMILAAIATALFVGERYYPLASQQERIGFATMTRQAFRCQPFRILLLALVLFAVPTSMVGALSWYVLSYHVFAGDPATAALYGGLGGTCYSILGALCIPFAVWLSRRIGKRRALQYALSVGAVALASSFVLYTPTAPILSALCHGLFGIVSSGFFWVLLPSMLADVIDFDEIESGKRREGAYASILSYVLKFGTTFAVLATGPLIELTGFDAHKATQSPTTLLWLRILFAGVPAVAALLAAVALRRYPLSRAAMSTIRARLEARRGAV
jgi:GPH family glycoside/pentoside/hexuronide:cation symporter